MMLNGILSDGKLEIPDSYKAINLFPYQSNALLRVALLTSTENCNDPFIVLHEGMTVHSYLGCLIDKGDTVKSWLQICLQNTNPFADPNHALSGQLTNLSIDQKWCSHLEERRELTGLLLETGYELEQASPIIVNTSEGTSRASGLVLCKDDQHIMSKELAAYTTSLKRYFTKDDQLYSESVTEGVASIKSLLNDGEQFFNAQGAMLYIQPFSQFNYDHYIDLLNGKDWQEKKHGKHYLDLFNYQENAVCSQPFNASSGRLILERYDNVSAQTEQLYLKLRVFIDALEAVKCHAAASEKPILNLK